jgi:hypothetical protein
MNAVTEFTDAGPSHINPQSPGLRFMGAKSGRQTEGQESLQ